MHSGSGTWSSWGYDWVSLGPETLPTFTTLSTLSINYFKMSPEPPNQSQLGLVTGLQTLPFSRKKAKRKDTMKKRDRKRGRASMCVCGGRRKREREVKTWWGVFHWSVALLCFCFWPHVFECAYARPSRSRKLLHTAPALWAGSTGAMGLVLWTIGVGFQQRGVLKENICMGSRQWREWRRVKGGRRRRRRRILASHNADLSIINVSRSCISEVETNENGGKIARDYQARVSNIVFICFCSKNLVWKLCLHRNILWVSLDMM